MSIIRITKQYIAVGISVVLILFYSLPVSAFAQEGTPDPTPTPAQTEVTNDATTTTITDTTANTGDNTIGEPTPSPAETSAQEDNPTDPPAETQTETLSPTPDPTPIPKDGSVTAINSAEVVNEATSSADTGNNEITLTAENPSESEETGGHEETSPTPTPSPAEPLAQEGTPTAVIDTGDAAAIATVDNSINTTEINSQVVYQTINLFVDQNGDIDLSGPAALAELITSEYHDEAVVNVALTPITNTADVNNIITSKANTGNNQINEPSGNAQITTGDAYSLIAMLNRINFVMIDSVLHIVTINIFGNFTGNIILPEQNNSTEPCPDCGTSTAINNDATVTNTIDSQAVSGQNAIIASDSAQITTGDAVSIVQLTNLINTNLIGAGLLRLIILPFGAWNGSFLGWGSIAGQEGGGPLMISSLSGVGGSGCPECTGDVSIGNQANLTNAIASTANSGGSKINAVNGTIQTGRAISLVSLINLVNTSLVRSTGFFGFINIFGNWVGNIGGASFFAEDVAEEEPATTDESQSTSDTPDVRESGGKLEITQTNNVANYVLPGDTVTFFVKVKNTGTGKVYGATLDLLLYQDGVNRGGAHFSLGDIDAGKGKKVTTGLVLSKETPGGLYTAVATVRGTAGPENGTVTARASSQFTVFVSTVLGTSEQLAEETPVLPELPNVLGADAKKDTPNILLALLVLILLIPVYKTVKIMEDPSLIRAVFAQTKKIMGRIISKIFFAAVVLIAVTSLFAAKAQAINIDVNHIEAMVENIINNTANSGNNSITGEDIIKGETKNRRWRSWRQRQPR